MLISIGDRVKPGTYELHSRFARAANYIRDGRLISLVTSELGPGPSRIVLRSRRLSAPDVLSISRRTVSLGERRFSRAGIPKYESQLRVSALRNLAIFEQSLVRHAPAHSLAYLLDARRLPRNSGFRRALALHMQFAAEEFLAALCEGPQRRLRNAVKQIAGCGLGLTPSGDDFIAGALIALRLLNKNEELARQIARAAQTDNALSAHFIELAAEGRAPEDVKQLSDALANGATRDVREAAFRVIKHGETSGADLATGLLMTLKECTRGTP